MAMTIEQEIEQLVLKCIALDGLKACPKDLAFLEKYGLKNLYFFSLEYAMEGTDTTVLDSKAKGLIRWYLYSTDFPLLRQKYEREGKAENRGKKQDRGSEQRKGNNFFRKLLTKTLFFCRI